MARIKIEDLPINTQLSAKDVANATGGYISSRLKMRSVGSSYGGLFAGRTGLTIQPTAVTLHPRNIAGITVAPR